MTTNPLDEIYGFSSAPKQHPLDAIYGSTSQIQIPQSAAQEPSAVQISKTVGETVKENIFDPFASRFKKINYGDQGILSNTLQTVGAVAGGVGEAVLNTALGAAKIITPDPVENIVSGAFQSAAQGVSQAVPDETKSAIAKWAEENPTAAANLNAIVDIASIVPLGKGAQAIKTAGTITTDAGKVAQATKATERIIQTPERVLSRKLEGATEFAPRPVAQDVLANLDTSNVRTYSDLRKTIEESNKLKLNQVDEFLKTDTTKYRAENFDINRSGLKFNPVTESLSSLKELGQKTFNTEILEKVNAYQAKLKQGEMMQIDVNNLARDMAIYKNAFAKNGNILKNTNAQKAENLRLELKNIARADMPDDVRRLDMEYSDAKFVLDAVQSMEKKIGNQVRKMEDLGIIRKTVGAVGNFADFFAARLITSAVREIKSIAKDGKLSPIDIENELAKNLEILSQATAKKDVKRVREFLKGLGLVGVSANLNQSNAQEQ